MTVTPTEVFTFLETDEETSSSKEAMITALIARTIAGVEAELGRSIHLESLSEAILIEGADFEYCENRMYLFGKYRDLFEVTDLQIDGETLDSYRLNAGMILLINDTWESVFFDALSQGTLSLSIMVTGKLGLVEKESPYNTLPDIAQIIIEMVAAKSGLWKTNVQTEGAEITTIRTTINPETKKALKKYKVALV